VKKICVEYNYAIILYIHHGVFKSYRLIRVLYHLEAPVLQGW